MLTRYYSDIKRDTPVLSGISDASLEAEIVRRSSSKGAALAIRESTCGSNERGEYNTPLHVMALFLVLVLSTLGIYNRNPASIVCLWQLR